MVKRKKSSTFPKRLQDVMVFHEIGKTITSTLDLKEVLQIIMDRIQELLKPQNWSLLLVDEAKDELYFEIVVGESADALREFRIKMGEGVAGWVAQTGTPLFIPDVKRDPRFHSKIDEIIGFTTHCILCAPLKSKGKVLGVIELVNDGVHGKFKQDDLFLLATLADYAAIAIENARYFLKIQELTITDDVTGLYNSRYLYQALESEIKRSKRYKKQLSLIFIDIDYFKHVNDGHGHLAGCRLLREVGEVFRYSLRNVDVVTRYGGDEFVIILPETKKDVGVLTAQRIRESLNEHVFHLGKKLNLKITASFGIASYPGDAKTATEIIRLADQAMYRVKEANRDGVSAA